MKRSFYSCLFLMSILLTGTVMWSCSDDNDDGNPDGPESPDYEVNVDEAQTSSTSAVVVLNTKDISEYAYQVKEGDVTTLPDGEDLFLTAAQEGNVIKCTGQTEKLSISGLEGNKKYTVLISLKHEKADKTVEYIVKSASVTTTNYEKLLTVVSTSRFGLKFHVECPADKYFRYTVVDKLMYEDRNMSFDQLGLDLTFLEQGAPLAKGSQTIEWEKVPLYPDEPDGETYNIYPGTTYYILVAECDKDGKMDFEFEDSGDIDGPILGSAVNTKASSAPELIGDCNDKPVDKGVTFNGFFARQAVRSVVPEQGNGEVKVNVTTQTEHTLAFDLTPIGDVKEYLVSVLKEEEYQLAKSWVGESGLQAGILVGLIIQPIAVESEASSLTLNNLEKDTKYHLFVTGICDDEGAVQTFTEMEVSTIVSTKPIPEIEVTGIQAPEGSDYGGPYNVWFNVKAKNKDCVAMKYLCNSVAEWVMAENGGSTIDDMFQRYGQPVDAEIINAINSDKGYDLSFASWENTESILKVASYNEDEAYGVFEGRSSSPAEQDKPQITSDLFNTLPGDYTTKITMSEENEDWEVVDVEKNIKMTVSSNPFTDSPANYAAFEKTTEYKTLFAYFVDLAQKGGSVTPEDDAKMRLKDLFDEYKEFEKKYIAKYRGQNRMVLTGYDVLDRERSVYRSPWALFCSLDGYNSYGTVDLFYDYGPKMFIEVTGTNKAIVPTNTQYIPPVLNWSDAAYYLAAKPTTGYVCGFADFPLNISNDGNTLEIGSIMGEDGETVFNPALAQVYGSTVYSAFSNDKPIVMQRGWTDKKTAGTRSISVASTGKKVNYRSGNHFRTTYLPSLSIKRKQIEAKYIPLNENKQIKK